MHSIMVGAKFSCFKGAGRKPQRELRRSWSVLREQCTVPPAGACEQVCVEDPKSDMRLHYSTQCP